MREAVKKAVKGVLKAMEDMQLIERFELPEDGDSAVFVLDRHHGDAEVTVNLLDGTWKWDLDEDDEG